jgi:hypothetical protein
MYLHIVELLSKRSSTFALARKEFQTRDNTQRITDVSFSSHQPPHLLLQPQLLRSRRCRRQKGAPRVRRGRRWGVDDDDGGRADFADAEIADDAGDVAAAAVARVLARAAIPVGEEGGGGGGGGGSAGASGWLS